MSMITYVIRVYMKNQISHVLCKKSVFLFKKSESWLIRREDTLCA